jgi:hypothetical protein
MTAAGNRPIRIQRSLMTTVATTMPSAKSISRTGGAKYTSHSCVNDIDSNPGTAAGLVGDDDPFDEDRRDEGADR